MKIIRKITLVTYMVLIILTFIPGLGLGDNINLFDFLLPIAIFNIVFWIIFSFAFPSNILKDFEEDSFLQGFSMILLHIPIFLIVGFIPSPLNALVFGLFTILIIAFS